MDTKQDNPFLTKRNLFIIVLVSIVLIIGVGTMAWWMTSNHAAPTEGPASQDDIKKAQAQAQQATADGKLRDQAGQAVKNNDTANADKLYQQAVAAAATAERKTQLYLDLSAVYYAAGRYDDAIAAAKKADDVNPDKFLMADWLSRIYEDRKDYAQAVDYYRLAAQWATSPQNKTGLDQAYYNTQADRVTKLGTGQ